MDGIPDLMDMNLSKLRELVMEREAWHVAVHFSSVQFSLVAQWCPTLYSCHFCGRGFAYPSELKAHEVKHESGRCHVCVECGLDFSTLTQLKRHLASHQGPTLYQCLECDKSFHYRSQLQNHMLKHQNVRPFVCTECGMEFSQIHHLKQHSLTHKVRAPCATPHPGQTWSLEPPRQPHTSPQPAS